MTEVGVATSATDGIATMIGTPSQTKKLTKTTAVGVEAAVMLQQRTKTSKTTTVVGVETLTTEGNTMAIGNQSQIKKSTRTTTVGVEAAATSRHQTKMSMTTTEVRGETLATNGVAAMIGTLSQIKKSTTTMAVEVEMVAMLRQQTKTLTTIEVGVETLETDGVTTTISTPSQIENLTTTMAVGVEVETTDDFSDVEFDANFANNDDDTVDNANCDPLDEEFRATATFVKSLAAAKPPCYRATKLAKVALPDGCVDMSTYCTQNAHGLWGLVTDEDGNRLSNQPWDMTRFEHLVASMKVKCLDVYFLQDTWLEDDKFDIDVKGYHVFCHNGPNGNHLHHRVAIVLLPCYYAGRKSAGAA